MTYAFSGHYVESRARFLAGVKDAGGDILHIPLSGHHGPNGESLSLDVGILGNRDSHKVLVMSAGVHGPEGPAGAAVLLDYLMSAAQTETQLKVILIHAVNPWGMAHGFRGNENNVDLNRNFIDHQHATRSNNEYEKADAELCQADIQGALDAIEDFFKDARSAEATGIISAIYKGQYSHPKGIGYGGHEWEWSIKSLLAALGKTTSSNDILVHIDWHTGTGTYGDPVPVSFHPPDSIQAIRLNDWYGSTVTQFDSAYETGKAPDFSGVIVSGLIDTYPQEKYHGLVVEFGTVKNDQIIRSFAIDRWLRFAEPVDPAVQGWARQEISETYCPADNEWRAKILTSGREVIHKISDGLRHLDVNGESR